MVYNNQLRLKKKFLSKLKGGKHYSALPLVEVYYLGFLRYGKREAFHARREVNPEYLPRFRPGLSV